MITLDEVDRAALQELIRQELDRRGIVGPGLLAVQNAVLLGTGVPSVATVPGKVFLRQDGGVGSTLYVKETGTDGTGWVAK